MGYGTYEEYRMRPKVNLPFAHVADSMSFVAEGVYAAAEAAVGLVGQAFRAAKVEARERSAVRVLSGLDDRTLKDIGVRRAEIRHLAGKVAENPDIDYRVMCER